MLADGKRDRLAQFALELRALQILLLLQINLRGVLENSKSAREVCRNLMRIYDCAALDILQGDYLQAEKLIGMLLKEKKEENDNVQAKGGIG